MEQHEFLLLLFPPPPPPRDKSNTRSSRCFSSSSSSSSFSFLMLVSSDNRKVVGLHAHAEQEFIEKIVIKSKICSVLKGRPNLIHVSTCRPSDDCQLPSPRLAQNRVRVQEKEACAGSQNHKIVLEGSHHDCLFASLSRIRPGLGTQPVWSCTWTKARTTRVPICVPSTF